MKIDWKRKLPQTVGRGRGAGNERHPACGGAEAVAAQVTAIIMAARRSSRISSAKG